MQTFISYSHRDTEILERLHVHLAPLRREGLIKAWFDREILAGDVIDADIQREINNAKLFLFLVSPDFLASNYCYEIEMQAALKRHDSGEARVIPIIVQPCDWKSIEQLRRLKALPKDGKPISDWTNTNTAYLSITQEIRRTLDESAFSSSTNQNKTIRETEGSIKTTNRYRAQRDFDDVDRIEYRDEAFSIIKEYFFKAIEKINEIDLLRGRIFELSPSAFTCSVVNRGKNRAVAHITVYRGSSNSMMRDIFYSFKENAPENIMNGWFDIDNDGYDQFLSIKTFGTITDSDRFTPNGAAECLWRAFLHNAGVNYA